MHCWLIMLFMPYLGRLVTQEVLKPICLGVAVVVVQFVCVCVCAGWVVES